MTDYGFHYPPGVTRLPGEEEVKYVDCPSCGADYDLGDYPEGISSCDYCGYIFP